MPSTDEVAVGLARADSNSFVGPGKSSWLSVRRGARRSASSCSGGQLGQPRPGRASGQGLGAERLGPAAGRVAELAVEEADDRVGDVVLLGVVLEVLRVGAGADEGEGEVADDLASSASP